MSMFTNKSILTWLQYFSDHAEIDLTTVRILDITGKNKNLLPTVRANRSVLVFTDAGHPEIFYTMWDAGLGECDIWYNEGSEPVGEMKHNKLSEMINRGINASAAMLINNPNARSTYRVGVSNDSFCQGSIRYVTSEIRAIIMNKLHLDERENLCAVSGESIAVEGAMATRYGHVVAVEYKSGDRQTMEENVAKFGLNNVTIVDSLESYSHRLPVPDVAFLVASPKLDIELKTLLRVNPNIRIVIYTLEFSMLNRVPSLLWDNGIEPAEVMQVEVSKLGRKDMFETPPSPWIISGRVRGQS